MNMNQLQKELRHMQNQRPRGPLSTLLGVGGVLAAIGSQCLYTVPVGMRAVLFHRFSGVSPETRGEGWNLFVPWFTVPELYSIRVAYREYKSPTQSKDLQTLSITLRVLARPKQDKLPEIHQTMGKEFLDVIMPSVAQEVLKSVVAQFNAAQLMTERNDVSNLVKKRLVSRAHDFHIDLDDVSITDIVFSPEYAAAIEAKQIAQQEAERAKFIVEKAEQEKLATVEIAEGEADAARMIEQAIKQNPAFIELRKIEAAREIAKTMSHSNSRLFLNSDTLLINLIGDAFSTTGNDNKKK